MILSNTSIHEALDRKWLVIDPVPEPRYNEIGKRKCPYDHPSQFQGQVTAGGPKTDGIA